MLSPPSLQLAVEKYLDMYIKQQESSIFLSRQVSLPCSIEQTVSVWLVAGTSTHARPALCTSRHISVICRDSVKSYTFIESRLAFGQETRTALFSALTTQDATVLAVWNSVTTDLRLPSYHIQASYCSRLLMHPFRANCDSRHLQVSRRIG